jgi:hypothetical protein
LSKSEEAPKGAILDDHRIKGPETLFNEGVPVAQNGLENGASAN